jgi:hypothetical protein
MRGKQLPDDPRKPSDKRASILLSIAELGVVPCNTTGNALLPPGHRYVTDWIPKGIIEDFVQAGYVTRSLDGTTCYITEFGRATVGQLAPRVLSLIEVDPTAAF